MQMSTHSIFLGVPVYGNPDRFFVQSLLGLLGNVPAGMSITVRPLYGDSLIPRARNTLTAQFLASDCTHLLFLDSDLSFSPELIARLVAHDLPVVGGMYAKKGDNDGLPEWVVVGLPGEQPDAQGLQRVRYTGTGALLIKRGVFQRLKVQADSYRPVGADRGGAVWEWNFWPVGVFKVAYEAQPVYLSEDWGFCELCGRAGIPVVVDTRAVFMHFGVEGFPNRAQRENMGLGLVRVEVGKMSMLATRAMAPHQTIVLAGEYGVALPRAPKTVLDLGANEGAFSRHARHHWPAAVIHAFEPVPENAELFRRNHRGDPRVKLTVAAVWPSPLLGICRGVNNSGEANLFDGDEERFLPAAFVKPETLPACEFVKLDVEGAEKQIVIGLDLSQALGLALEYHDDDDVEFFTGHLSGRGFSLARHTPTPGTGRGILTFVRTATK